MEKNNKQEKTESIIIHRTSNSDLGAKQSVRAIINLNQCRNHKKKLEVPM
jgi:hypothetical protein